MSIRKWQVSPAFLAVATGLSSLLIGIVLIVGLKRSQHREQAPATVSVTDTKISPLLPQTPAQRAIPLEALAQLKQSQTGNRARYLLATDQIQQRQADKALTSLRGLEQDYPLLGPEILVKRAQAYELSGKAEATATWQEVLKRHPDQPAAAEALYALGRRQPQYWDQAIAQFPAHPRTVEIAQARLQQNPKQPQLLLLLAKHALYLPDITTVLDRLKEYKAQLTPTDWAAIAFGYWQEQDYGKAATAYALAPPTPLNAYRTGRGFQLDGKNQQAIQAYQRMVALFPNAKETPRALIRLASLLPPKQALQPLDRAIQIAAAAQAGEALLAKASLLDSLNSSEAATQARQQLLTAYSQTDAAAEFRWLEAEKRAESQDISGAVKWAEQITHHNPNSELAPQATFWTAKWANQIGSKSKAARAFKQVLASYPESYYAWRTAALQGWSVGDFTTVRHLSPTVAKSNQRLALPTGSSTLKELYQLRQDQDAWVRWQWEYRNRIEPTVAEQLTDGLLRLEVGDNLAGIFLVSDLKARSRSEPESLSQYQAWQQQPEYWQALYPLPYLEAVQAWSRQRQLNPFLVMALIRQESRFQPTIRSSAGAVGLMQVMPGTASWIAEQAKLNAYNLEQPQDNIKLGTWYLDYTHEEYNDNSMLAVASYNAGPGNVASWVKQGLRDPDEFVEAIPFPETKGYVKAVFENYWNYLRLYNPKISELLQKQT